MTQPPKLDHTVINVRYQMDQAETAFRNLGFQLTDRGYHSLGSINHLMMFGSDYLELIGLPSDLDGKKSGRPDIESALPGINGLVFNTTNVDETYAHLQQLGMAGEPPKSFSRPVDMPEGTRDARFRTVTVRGDVFPAGRVYFCEHGTPELVWRPEWQTHQNTARSMPEFVIVSENHIREAEGFARLLHSNVDGSGDHLNVKIDGSKITLLSPPAYRARYGDLASSLEQRPSLFGAIIIQTTDLAPIRAWAKDAKLPMNDAPGHLILRIPAFNCVLEFVC